MYRLHTWTPSHVAPSARASATASTSGLSPHVGCPSKPTWTSSIPTRDAIATPFHWLKPQCTTSYPIAANGIVGNWSSAHLVSCIASTSTSARSSQAVTRSTRARMLLTFQVARRTASAYELSVAERIGYLARRPRQPRHTPPVRLDRALSVSRVPAHQAVQVQQTVEVPGLVLQHPGEQVFALQRHRCSVGVHPGDPCPLRPPRRERLA